MQFYNKLKHKFQQQKKETSLTPPKDELRLCQHKPPLVDSRSQWNTNVYLVPKWEKKEIKRVDSLLHTPFPIRNYINYIQQHNGGFKDELNLDFFKHIFRHFAINQWWIEEARKLKQTIPINILQSPEVVRQNPEYCRLMMQKQKDDLKFYQEILRNVKSPSLPFPSRQIPEYRKSITYQILDLHGGQEHKDKSLFQLQDVFVNRIIQLISDQGIQSLGYYDYVTFKNIVQDRIKGTGDAENFVKILEIKRLFNSVDQIQKEFEKTVNEWQREQTQASNNTKTKFRRWQQEKTLFSEEILQLATNVGLDSNLVKARKNFERNQTEQQFKELIKVGDQIQLNTHKTILDTLSKIAQEELNNISNNNSIFHEDALQLARVQYEEQKDLINKENSLEDSFPQQYEQQKKETSLTPPKDELRLCQHKPPLVDSRSQWNTNVYLVPKWEKKEIKRVDSLLHTPFPIRNYINYIQQHNGGFKDELNLDFFKHIFRHFAINQWWIEEARKLKQTIPINILQSPEVVRQNPEYQILRNVKSPSLPFPSRQIPEYRKSITYQILDLHGGQEHKDKSLFQLQDVFVNRIIQLISDQGIQSLGYYDYVTFKNIVQDRIKGTGDAENFVKILEIKRLFNSVDQIQKEFEKTVNEWQREQTQASNNTKTKFRRWQQEKTLFSEEILQLATNVGLDSNLVKARKNFERNQTEQQFKELIKVGDQIQLNTHKTILDTLSKIAQEELNNISNNNSIFHEDALQLARVQYEEQKDLINKENSLEDSFPQQYEVPSSKEWQKEFFQNSDQSKQQKQQDQKQKLHSNQQQKPFLQYSKQQQYQAQSKPANSTSPQKRIRLISENNSRSYNTSSNQNNTHRNLIQSQGQERMLQSQWSQQSLNSIEDIIKPTYENDYKVFDKNDKDKEKNSMQFYQKIDYKDSKQFENVYKEKIDDSRNSNFIRQHQYNEQQDLNIGNNNTSVSLINKNTNSSINDDIKLLNEFVQQNRISQQKFKDKIFSYEKEKDELRQLQEELENISRDDNMSNLKKNTLETLDKEKSLGQSRTLSSKENKKHKEPIQNQVKLDYGYNVPSTIPGSVSNNTTARTSRNTSNYNSKQNKRSKINSIEEAIDEQRIQQQQIFIENENVKKNSPDKYSRQASSNNIQKSDEQGGDGKQQIRNSRHSRQDKSQVRETNLQINQMKRVNQLQDTKQDEINNNQITQQSNELSPQKSKRSTKSPEKTKQFQKSVTKIIDSNKQIKKEQQKLEIINKPFENQLQTQQDVRKSRHKTGNRETVNESSEEELEYEEEEKRNNNKFKRQNTTRKVQFHSVSMPKIGRDDDPRRYLLMLKDELKEMIDKRVSLREIKDHINLIFSETAGIKLDPELEYYLQLYKQRVLELTQVNHHSREIHFSSFQPKMDLKMNSEIKGLKFGRNCDRIPKLQPKDLEDTFVLQQQIQKESGVIDLESQIQSYQPVFRYDQRPQPLKSDIVQVSLLVSRKKTPNTYRQDRAGSLIDIDLAIVSQRKSTMQNNKKKKKTRYIGQTSIKRDKLNEDYPFLYKYKPQLLKSILEARISLEQLV
ncbi:unnamed protein product [Paramecium sonneborni]|uniref:Uncharacterized protein n=1 Tax=Paramecium sonneborni TaxID=65129 RepID=A0A8S1PJZ4_9CILI|nr:unnamed protein product [Paramecium sonneborni]